MNLNAKGESEFGWEKHRGDESEGEPLGSPRNHKQVMVSHHSKATCFASLGFNNGVFLL